MGWISPETMQTMRDAVRAKQGQTDSAGFFSTDTNNYPILTSQKTPFGFDESGTPTSLLDTYKYTPDKVDTASSWEKMALGNVQNNLQKATAQNEQVGKSAQAGVQQAQSVRGGYDPSQQAAQTSSMWDQLSKQNQMARQTAQDATLAVNTGAIDLGQKEGQFNAQNQTSASLANQKTAQGGLGDLSANDLFNYQQQIARNMGQTLYNAL